MSWNTEPGTAALRRRRDLDRQAVGLCRLCVQSYPSALLRVEYAWPLDQGGADEDRNVSTVCLWCSEDRARERARAAAAV